MRVGLIRNPKSHRNLGRARAQPLPAGVMGAEPDSQDDLREALAAFAEARVEALAIEGGDGTVRDILSLLPGLFETPPMLAVYPLGKTNVLARDLGPPPRLPALAAGIARPSQRRPLELSWPDGEHSPVHGFILGAAAYRRATELSKRVNRAGIFQTASVALTLALAIDRALTGRTDNEWRAGEDIAVAVGGAAAREGRRFLLLASTLERLPLGARPFGAAPEGIGWLDIEAPARRLSAMLLPVLRGRDDPRLEPLGYRRGGAEQLSLAFSQPFIVDGELFPAGRVEVALGAPIRFALA
ncbi:MAG TPA: diacylglycerol kinase family protein [Phenylobacterium sp.]|nr:diacylglycerol kinase family protein [Phenylobacterium sp.]